MADSEFQHHRFLQIMKTGQIISLHKPAETHLSNKKAILHLPWESVGPLKSRGISICAMSVWNTCRETKMSLSAVVNYTWLTFTFMKAAFSHLNIINSRGIKVQYTE